MLSLEERADLLVKSGELGRKREHARVLALLSHISEEDLLAEPELGVKLALSHFQLSHFVEAQALLDKLEVPCRRGGFDQLYRRRLNLVGNLLTERGDIASAEVAYLEVLDRSILAGDHRWVALATMNLSAIAGIRGEWVQAITAAHRGMTALQLIGDGFHLAGCHQNLAMAYREMNLFTRADSHFDKATQLYLNCGSDVDARLSSLEIERSVAMSGTGDQRRAIATLRRATDRLTTLELQGHSVRRDRGEASRALAIIQIADSQLTAARGSYEDALKVARSENALLLEGEVCEGLCDLAAREGRTGEAMHWAAEASTIYTKLSAFARIRHLQTRVRQLATG